jgi:hypothetical protein
MDDLKVLEVIEHCISLFYLAITELLGPSPPLPALLPFIVRLSSSLLETTAQK